MRHAATRRGVDHRHGNSDLLHATTSTKSLYAAASAVLLAAAVRLNPSLADGVPLLTKTNAGKFGAPPAAAAAASSAAEDAAAAMRLNPSLAGYGVVPLPTKTNVGKEFLGAQPPIAAAATVSSFADTKDDVATLQPSGPPLLVGGTPFNYYERDGTTMDGVNLNDSATYYHGNDAIDVGYARYDVEGIFVSHVACAMYIM